MRTDKCREERAGRVAVALAGSSSSSGETSARSRVDTLDPKTGAKTLWPLASFVALAYAVSWAWMFPLVAAGDVVEKGVGWPTHFPVLFGPALAAFVVTAGSSVVRAFATFWPGWPAGACRCAGGRRRSARSRFLGVALAVAWAGGTLPRGSDFGRFSGLSAIGIVPSP